MKKEINQGIEYVFSPARGLIIIAGWIVFGLIGWLMILGLIYLVLILLS